MGLPLASQPFKEEGPEEGPEVEPFSALFEGPEVPEVAPDELPVVPEV